ncbi:hypothetical protein [Geminicoccus harenae]|nr:hypothetical protein [Geminicoccus harenae]
MAGSLLSNLTGRTPAEILEKRTWFTATYVLGDGQRMYLRRNGSFGMFCADCLFEERPEGIDEPAVIAEVEIIVRSTSSG